MSDSSESLALSLARQLDANQRNKQGGMTLCESMLNLVVGALFECASAPPDSATATAASPLMTDGDMNVLVLRQALWDVYGTLGFDQDGNRTPAAVCDLPGVVRRAAEEFRREFDATVNLFHDREG